MEMPPPFAESDSSFRDIGRYKDYLTDEERMSIVNSVQDKFQGPFPIDPVTNRSFSNNNKVISITL